MPPVLPWSRSSTVPPPPRAAAGAPPWGQDRHRSPSRPSAPRLTREFHPDPPTVSTSAVEISRRHWYSGRPELRNSSAAAPLAEPRGPGARRSPASTCPQPPRRVPPPVRAVAASAPVLPSTRALGELRPSPILLSALDFVAQEHRKGRNTSAPASPAPPSRHLRQAFRSEPQTTSTTPSVRYACRVDVSQPMSCPF